jgi:hypothetical protein
MLNSNYLSVQEWRKNTQQPRIDNVNATFHDGWAKQTAQSNDTVLSSNL